MKTAKPRNVEPNARNTKHSVDDKVVRLDKKEVAEHQVSDKEYERNLDRIGDTTNDPRLKGIIQKERRARLGKGNIIQI